MMRDAEDGVSNPSPGQSPVAIAGSRAYIGVDVYTRA
jgi:hypothetical protein